MPKNSEDNERLFKFFSKLDRSFFIDNEYKDFAADDRPLPIGHEQTISQPSLVLEMTLALELNKAHNVLEIGTGSGYQTAFLAQFGGQVFTIERIEELSKRAQEKLSLLGYNNIRFKIGDGSDGWREFSPFDRIIVTAAAAKVPDNLIHQLVSEGRMVIPVGDREGQKLLLIHRDKAGKTKKKSLGKVRFVEFKGKYGW
ncbi:MAG: protein-L-isoaspartate(D-aspartate) O-methyltransferase [Syntrophomonadaceae bacterium]|nr:protein-L-isoaspartate(D-aspartate) O-methyltransferase [Syntrophomonadaceae bacterium]MDD4550310.1 protein-L-isoaspartate(D-aspartate) O-methyltransferase [Syntrophomonadaceae bacterium]